jgi:hypothetical protein
MAEPAYPWGRLPEPPDVVKEFSEAGESEVEFIGQLSIAQERDVNISRVLKILGVSEIFFKYQPELVEKVKWSQTYEKFLEAANFAQGDIVPEEEYQEIINVLKQRQLQAELAENYPKMANAVKSLQSKTEEGSPMELIEGAVA